MNDPATKLLPERKGRFLSGEQCLALDAELGPYIEASEFLMLEAKLSLALELLKEVRDEIDTSRASHSSLKALQKRLDASGLLGEIEK